MTVESFADPATFLDAARKFLVTEPISTNVIATVTTRLVDSGDAPGDDDAWLLARDGTGHATGAAMIQGRWNLFVSQMPTAAAVELADHLGGSGRVLPGVSGERLAAHAFVDHWTDHGATTTAECILEETAYVLGELCGPAGVAGHARMGGPDDLDLTVEWLRAFHDEATPRDPIDAVRSAAAGHLERGEVKFWFDGDRPVSMAAFRTSTLGVTRIGPVYTPPEHRNNGYAAAVTTAVAEHCRSAGATTVMLYADEANPTSNALYQRLGFRPDHHLDQYRFT